MTLRLIGLVLCLALTGCGGPQTSRLVELDGCAELTVQGEFNLDLKVADGTFIELQGRSDDLAAVVVQASGQRVSIASISPATIHAQVSCPDLDTLELIGSVKAEQMPSSPLPTYRKVAVYGDSTFIADKLTAGILDLRAGGNAQITIDDLVVDALQILLSGHSSVIIEGETGQMKVELGGNASLTAVAFQAQSVNLQARGYARAGVFATAHLVADLQDATSLAYNGAPDLAIKRTQFTRLRKL